MLSFAGFAQNELLTKIAGRHSPVPGPADIGCRTMQGDAVADVQHFVRRQTSDFRTGRSCLLIRQQRSLD